MLRKNQQQFNIRMPIQLDKILSDIAEEKVLHPNYPSCEKKQVDDAWIRVGKKNKLSVHEARSIFKVLQKKYEQERVKESSAWKLFSVMDEIHKKQETKTDVKTEEEESDLPMEEDEEYEMLDVQEEEEHHTAAGYAATGPASDGESPNKSHKSNSSTGSPEKDEKPVKTFGTPKSANALRVSVATTQNVDEKKILNSLPSASSNKYIPSTPTTQATTAAAAAALQKKGITMKKTTPTPVASTKTALVSVAQKTTPVRSANSLLDVGKNNRIQLPDSLKRKLSEDHSPSPQQKRTNLAQAAAASVSTSSKQQQEQQHNNIALSPSQAVTSKPTQIKDEHEEFCPQEQQQQPASHGINLITIPANPIRTDLTNGVAVGLITNTTRPSSSTAATVASTSTNGFSPRIEDIDFRNDIIFDTGTGNVTNGGGGLQQSVNRVNHQSTEIINLGNFDNSLPPTFFKNLCNSSRHEALGLYVANVMNRLGTRAAAKLELGILRAIIDVQSDELEQ